MSSVFNRRQTLKLVLTALFACLSFVLCTFVSFPAMAPFQHFVNVIAEVFLGPWYACAAAFACGVMRMFTGRTIQAITGAVFGPIIGGLLYRRTKNVYLAMAGEVFGTGVVGAIASYFMMKWFFNLGMVSPLYYIPFYTPAAAVGAGMGVAAVLALRRAGILERMLKELEG